ncbi:MAG: hypothetical protein P4M09_07080 [Devosia sp.]|nr:hypothetical protein [Devosia sp.]
MSLSGPQVLNALDEALRDIRREEDEILRKLGRSAERIAKIRDTEAELLQQFAHGRVEPERETGLTERIIAANAAAREALKHRAAEMAAAAAHLAELDAEHMGLVAERAAALGELDEQQAALRGLSARIGAAIERDPAYGHQQELAASLKTVAATARTKARQADVDREQKGRPYRADPLFTYLLGRGYGTADYKGKGLPARLDAWVARLIGFTTAHPHYLMLNALPAALRAHAERQAGNAAAAEEAMDEIEQAAIDAAGGAAIRRALGDAQQYIAAIDQRITALQDERNAMTAAQTMLTTAEDAVLDRAITALAQALGGSDIQAVILDSRLQRPGPDDPVIAQLDDARLRISEERVDTHDLHARLATLAARRRELEDIEYEFKARRFDDPRSLFRDDDLVSDQLSEFLTGVVSAKTYWSAFRLSQAWDVGTSEWGGGVGLPRRGRQTGEPGAARQIDGFTRPRTTAADAEA